MYTDALELPPSRDHIPLFFQSLMYIKDLRSDSLAWVAPGGGEVGGGQRTPHELPNMHRGALEELLNM